MALISYSVKNFRSFTEEAIIPVKPITILLGRNSSGKSSLLRILPLLRQSIEVRTLGPFLWYGPYVDFGSYTEIMPKTLPSEDTSFGFVFKGLPHYSLRLQPLMVDVKITIQLGRESSEEVSYVRFVHLALYGHHLVLNLNQDGDVLSYKLNDTELKEDKLKLKLKSRGSLFALVIDDSNDDRYSQTLLSYHLMDRVFLQEIRRYLKPILSRSTQNSNILPPAIMSILSVSSCCELKKIIRKKAKSANGSAFFDRTSLESYVNNDEWILGLQGLIIASRLPRILSTAENQLSKTALSLSYLGPIRATANRYYRRQELPTDEVGSQGENIAIFLANLTENERTTFSNWCKETMGFEVNLAETSGHISILLKELAEDKYHNIADVGFGYSQVLPLLVSIWSMQEAFVKNGLSLHRAGRRAPAQHIFSVEQPELHLHPHYQAKLADLYCSVIKQAQRDGFNLSFLVETHSESIINRLGSLVYEKKFEPTDISILLVEKSQGKSSVQHISFNDDGLLENWPYGFFLPEMQEG